MKRNKFAIIIPVYNGQEYIHESISSLLKQTYQDWIAIIVDDGSTDSSYKLLFDYSLKDNRLLVFTKKNEGVGSSRNHALNILKDLDYDWLSFLDIDDSLDPQRYENINSLINRYNNSEIDFIRCFNLITPDRKNLIPTTVDVEPRVYSLMEYVKNNLIGGYMHNAIISRKMIDKYNIKFPANLKIFEDQVFTQKYLVRSHNILVYNKRDYFYYKPHNPKKYKSILPDLLNCMDYLFSDSYVNEIPYIKDYYYTTWISEKIPIILKNIKLIEFKKVRLPYIKNPNMLHLCKKQNTKIKYLFYHLLGLI